MTDIPDTLPTWATDGAADVADPGSAKRAAGFLKGEKPSAGHLNHQLNLYGQSFESLFDLLGPQLVIGALNRTSIQPFGEDILTTRIRYDSLADRWYAGISENVSGDGLAYDSVDGETWSSGKLIDSGLLTGSRVSAPVSDGDRVFAHADSLVWRSSNTDVANLSHVGSFTFITKSRGMVWDEVNQQLIAVGNNYIETSPDGVSWTVRLTMTNDATAVAHDPATGTTVAITDDAIVNTTIYTSTNGTAWTDRSAATAGQYFTNVVWSDSLKAFVAITNTSEDLWISVNGGATWTNASSNSGLPSPSILIMQKQFVLLIDKTTKEVLALPTEADELGRVNSQKVSNLFNDSPSGTFLGGSTYEGSFNKVVFDFNSDSGDHRLGVSQYRPGFT